MFNDFMYDVRHTDDLWLVLERSAVVAVIVDAALERSVLGSLCVCVNYTSQEIRCYIMIVRNPGS